MVQIKKLLEFEAVQWQPRMFTGRTRDSFWGEGGRKLGGQKQDGAADGAAEEAANY
jgi:hypothetical protein